MTDQGIPKIRGHRIRRNPSFYVNVAAAAFEAEPNTMGSIACQDEADVIRQVTRQMELFVATGRTVDQITITVTPIGFGEDVMRDRIIADHEARYGKRDK